MSGGVLECVPNVSEGRDPSVVEKLAAEVTESADVTLLDYSSDPDHNRSVFTYIGPPEAVLDATLKLCAAAFEAIDMRRHTGAHPRLGAVDVVPLVPVREVSMEEAVVYAHQLGRRIGELDVPVFFYERAALVPERRNTVKVLIFFDVGARPPLVAFNVNLGTGDLAVARRIADAVRQRTGGFECVKAMGVPLSDKGQVQVSMNLTDVGRTPIHRVVETIRFEAARDGVPIVGCELIGLAPLSAFEETLRHYLQLHEFSTAQIIETRLL